MNSLLEVHRFALNMVRGVADEDYLANEAGLQEGVGAGGSDVAASDDGDACVLRGHGGVLSSWRFRVHLIRRRCERVRTAADLFTASIRLQWRLGRLDFVAAR